MFACVCDFERTSDMCVQISDNTTQWWRSTQRTNILKTASYSVTCALIGRYFVFILNLMFLTCRWSWLPVIAVLWPLTCCMRPLTCYVWLWTWMFEFPSLIKAHANVTVSTPPASRSCRVCPAGEREAEIKRRWWAELCVFLNRREVLREHGGLSGFRMILMICCWFCDHPDEPWRPPPKYLTHHPNTPLTFNKMWCH